MYELRRRVLINFLYHFKKIPLEEAEALYESNIDHINSVFNLIGEDIMMNILKEVSSDK